MKKPAARLGDMHICPQVNPSTPPIPHVGGPLPPDPDNVVFLPIQAIDSETDHFPLGEKRKKYAPDYLKQMDGEMDTYLAAEREGVLDVCREIIRAFS